MDFENTIFDEDEISNVFISYHECCFIMSELNNIFKESNNNSNEIFNEISIISSSIIKTIDEKIDSFEDDDLNQLNIGFDFNEFENIFNDIKMLYNLSNGRNDLIESSSKKIIQFIDEMMID